MILESIKSRYEKIELLLLTLLQLTRKAQLNMLKTNILLLLEYIRIIFINCYLAHDKGLQYFKSSIN